MEATAEKLDFRQQVGIELLKRDKDRAWLCDQITERTGLFCDIHYLSRILNGKRKGKRICAEIRDILGLEDEEEN